MDRDASLSPNSNPVAASSLLISSQPLYLHAFLLFPESISRWKQPGLKPRLLPTPRECPQRWKCVLRSALKRKIPAPRSVAVQHEIARGATLAYGLTRRRPRWSPARSRLSSRLTSMQRKTTVAERMPAYQSPLRTGRPRTPR